MKIELSTRDCVLATWEGVVLGLWRGQTTAAAMRRVGEIVNAYAVERQGPLVILTVVEKNAPLPPSDARAELVSFLKGGNGLVERHGLVFEGEGFRAASIRAVVAGVALFSRPDYPYRVFESVRAAARFLVAGRNGTLAPHRLVSMVAEARSDSGAQALLPWLTPSARSVDAPHPR